MILKKYRKKRKFFYENLYSSKNKNWNQEIEWEFLAPNIVTPKLQENQKVDLDRQITEGELQAALKSFNKSPGNDGIPFEFCKTFWDNLKYFY